MTSIVEHAREGQILTSIPGIGPLQAAIIIASIGNIANFSRPAQLKAYFGWAPTMDRTHLSPRGTRLMKQTMYLIVWTAIKMDCEWARIYQHLVPVKCNYNERLHRHVGLGKVIGRLAGQIISVIFALLKKDQETLSKLAPGATPPNPVLYDPEVHRKHRAGQYRSMSPKQQANTSLYLLPH